MSGWIKRFLNWTVAEAERRAFRVNEIEQELTCLMHILDVMNQPPTTDEGCPIEPTDQQKAELDLIKRAFAAYEEQLRAEAESL